MSNNKPDFLNELEQRGYIHQCTDLDGMKKAFSGDKIVPAYIGFDATASSLHVGSLVQIMMLRWLQRAGHKPIVLMGGGTTKIGDPTGRDESRKMLTNEAINQNIQGIFKVFDKYLTFAPNNEFDPNTTDAVMVNNADWLDQLGYLEVLREVGPHFTINRMLTFDSVKLRLERENPMTFLEFNYMILQAYDFMKLNREKGVQLQMGGSDQWGNIVNGIELSRRMHALESDAGKIPAPETFGLTTPLLTLANGAKMGKSANGAIWLNEDELSAYDFWQFWRNTDDRDVVRFLKLFTELPMARIEELEKLEGADINEAKKVLATEVTKLAHGEKAALEAAETAQRAFEQGAAAEGLPTFDLDAEFKETGLGLVEALQLVAFAKSKGEARRLIKGGGARVNDVAISDEEYKITPSDLQEDNVIKVSAGKKRHALLKVS